MAHDAAGGLMDGACHGGDASRGDRALRRKPEFSLRTMLGATALCGTLLLSGALHASDVTVVGTNGANGSPGQPGQPVIANNPGPDTSVTANATGGNGGDGLGATPGGAGGNATANATNTQNA